MQGYQDPPSADVILFWIPAFAGLTRAWLSRGMVDRVCDFFDLVLFGFGFG